MTIFDAIRQRRAIFPAQYTSEPIDDATIWQLLEAANYAPTHKLTQPWRFRVLASEGAKRGLGEALKAAYIASVGGEEAAMPKMLDKWQNQPSKASHLIAIVLHRDEEERVPEWEELAAVAMSVQNIWLAATTLGLGGYWSSPKICQSAQVAACLELGARETCYGFFYLAQHNAPQTEAIREDIRSKVVWR